MEDELRRVAREARAEVEAATDVDGHLAAVRRRHRSSRWPGDDAPRSGRRVLAGLSVAAVLAVVVVVGVLAVSSDSDESIQSATATSTVPSTLVASTPSTEPASASASASTAPATTDSVPSTTTTAGDAVSAELIAVSGDDDLPEVEIEWLATVPWDGEGRPDAAIGELGVVVNSPDRSSILLSAFSGEPRTVPLQGEVAESGVSNLVYGPGDVVYGLRPIGPPFAFEMVAVPLSGDRAGEIVARSEPLDAATWVELPPSPFGHGPDGIIARARDVGTTIMGYVDVDGEPTELEPFSPWFPTITDDLLISAEGNLSTWALEINGQRTPTSSFTGPAVPAPSTDDRIVYPTYLDTDQTRPIIAVLDTDGTGVWAKPPDGFDYLASDSAGTAFGRLTDGTLEIGLLASDRVNWRTLGGDGAGVAEPCEGCTQLLVGVDGVPVSFDPSTLRVVKHSVPPVEATLPSSYTEPADGAIRPFLYHLGPDDVAYFQVAPVVPAELAADLVAISLADGNAGREIARWPGVTDNVGDSELVATPGGLVNVNCCGGSTRPASDAEIVVPWVARDGSETVSTSSTIRVDIDFPTLTVERTDQVPTRTTTWSYEPGDDWQPRGMPTVLPTFDGGFIAATFDGGSTVARGWPDGSIETIRFDRAAPWPTLDPAGRILFPADNFFIRVEPFVDRTNYWAGERDVNSAGELTLPGLDDPLATAPEWASDPTTFAHVIAGPAEVNETRSIVTSQQSENRWTATVTTSNLFDDSTRAVRLEILLGRGDDGQFRFVDGTLQTACQPGRGRQAFGVGPCT